MDLVPGNSVTGIEVGVFAAQFSSTLLPLYPRIKKLYGIDPYSKRMSYATDWPQEKWDCLYIDVENVMRQYGDRWELIRLPAIEAAVEVLYWPLLAYHSPNPGVDFIYLDGDHSASNLKTEIPVFELLLKHGGVLAGHDYFNQNYPGVRFSVDAYANYFRRPLIAVKQVNMWYWIKP
jgi:hypothetical protein